MSDTNRHMAKFNVTEELIREVLDMPEGSKILNIIRHEFNPDQFVMFVEHPSLPVVSEGGTPMEITPSYSRVEFDFNLPEVPVPKKIKMYGRCAVEE